jgi:hypothetical protein
MTPLARMRCPTTTCSGPFNSVASLRRCPAADVERYASGKGSLQC